MTTRQRGVWLAQLEAADVADTLHLGVLRTLSTMHVTDALDRCAVISELIARLEQIKDENALQAVADGESYASLGRALGGISRQAARQYLRSRQSDSSGDVR